MRLLFGGKLVLILTVSAIFLLVIIDNRNSSYQDRLTRANSQPNASEKINHIDWGNNGIETINSKNILINYFKWIDNQHQACKRPLYVTNTDGRGKSGQSICLDPAIVPRENCLIYSFDYYLNESSFESKMKNSGCQVFKFNPDLIISTSHGAKRNQKNRKKDGRNKNALKSLYRFIEQLLNGRNRDVDYVKMDIEGEEWDIIPRMLASGFFSKIRQLGVELHLFPNADNDEKTELNYFRDLARKIQTLEKKGRMIRFHSKEITCSSHYGILREKWPADKMNQFPTNCFEMAWYRKSN